MTVSALLVSHDGASWLPTVLAGLRDGTRQPDRLVAVDTGSTDASPVLVRDALGTEPLALPADATYAAAVRAGLAALPPAVPDEWVWLLHDDAVPAPDCLEVLLATAAEGRHAVLGPALREWPSLRRLLEVGVTISGTGRRETGLEPGEYDQGQHDEVREVLAVNTAGMLVRRDLLEELGLEDGLPFVGTDLDLGWRAALAGHRTAVVPDALVHHAEATRQGRRAAVPDPRATERAAQVTVLLANGSRGLLVWRALRLLVGGLLRALGLLLVRALPEARSELAGLAAVYLHPGRVLAMRRTRRAAGPATGDARPLLAPWWVPYRHGLDGVSDFAAAVLDLTRERLAGDDDAGPGRRVLRAPLTWVALVLLVVALVAGRDLLGGGPLHGGALLSPPDGVGQWWSLWAHGWHPLGTGTSAPAAPWVLFAAVPATLLLGSAYAVVWLVVVLGVPLAALAAHRFTRRVLPGRWLPAWAAAAYALLPVLSGALAQGRFGTLAAAVVLPFAATSALGLAADEADRRERAVWRTALGSALVVALVPPAWLVVLLVVALLPWLTGRRQALAHLVTLVVVPLVLVLPWLLGTLSHPGAWLLQAGRAGVLRVDPTALDLLLGRAGGPGGAPSWVSVGLVVAALLALLRAGSRPVVTRAWVVAAVAALVVVGLSWARVTLPGLDATVRPYAGFPLLLVHAALVVAAGSAVTVPAAGWRRAVGAVVVVAAVATPLLGAAWWVLAGTPRPLVAGPVTRIPAYMTEVSATSPSRGVLVVRGGGAGDVRYRVLRDGPLRLGDEGVLALTPEERDLTTTLSEVLSGSQAPVAERLAARGVGWVFAPAPVSAAVSGAFDAADGFTGASAPTDGSRAWKLDATPTEPRPASTPVHRVAVVLQVLALLVVLVLAAPSRRRRTS